MFLYTMIVYYKGIHHSIQVKSSMGGLNSIVIDSRDERSEQLIQAVELIIEHKLFDIPSDFITFEDLDIHF